MLFAWQWVVEALALAAIMPMVVRAARKREPIAAGSAMRDAPGAVPTISIVIPARNEELRIGACLDGLRGAPGVTEVIVVDDDSSDATARVAAEAGARVVHAEGRPERAMGKPWALRCGVDAARGEWIVTLDADTRPDAQLALALVARAIRDDLALASAGGRFRCRTAMGRWLHAAMLTTLVYRFGAGGTPGKRGVANGQCLAFRRSDAIDGAWFDVVAHDIVEDVALARHVHGAGKRVGFVDASRLLVVEMFDGFADTWRGWGRSLALPGVEPMWRQIVQVIVLGVVMVLAPVSIALGVPSVVSIVIVAMRIGTLFGTRRAYERGGAGYWLSPLADPIAVLAVLGNVIVPRRVWRGRSTRKG